MRQEGYYWLISGKEKTLTYYYQNPDTMQWGFGFNIADGGGFLPENDLTEETKIVFNRKTAICEITDFDIATIEALHDLLLDKHNYSLNHRTLKNARTLIKKMYKAFGLVKQN